ncbi:Small nuclear ribonucleoprotein E [Lachnellula suecica]|uniref:Small nuclear ribonucleoprotein E n=1 Tax=Lachnellula suecica TaxID=602035 RepID=A0A8T9C6U2_9HELO|nr:Small nuclear ribonucleoprotein E [Lachnellula suecica]
MQKVVARPGSNFDLGYEEASHGAGSRAQGRKVLLPPINFIFKLLRQRSTAQIWLYRQLAIRIEDKIREFDEFVNLVIDVKDAFQTEQSREVAASAGLQAKDEGTLVVQHNIQHQVSVPPGYHEYLQATAIISNLHAHSVQTPALQMSRRIPLIPAIVDDCVTTTGKAPARLTVSTYTLLALTPVGVMTGFSTAPVYIVKFRDYEDTTETLRDHDIKPIINPNKRKADGMPERRR